MRFLLYLSVGCVSLSLLIGCGIVPVTEIPPAGSGAPVERILIHYTVADQTLAPYAAESYDDLLSVGELPKGTELILFADIDGERGPRFHRRNAWEREELSLKAEEIPVGSGGEARVLTAVLRYARRRAPEAEFHLILSGRGSFDERLSLAAAGEDALELEELKEALKEGPFDTVTLDSSYGAAFSILYELRGSAERLLASPGTVSLSGLSPRALIDGLAGGATVPDAVIDAFRAGHRMTWDAGIGSFDLSVTEECFQALEGILALLEEELADPLERVALRDLFFDPSPYRQSAGALFLSLSELIRIVGARYPALTGALTSLEVALEELSESTWSSGGSAVTPSLYLVSLDNTGAPEGHAGCYLPELPGPPSSSFVGLSRWPPRLMEERGILYLLWYDLLPGGGAQ